MSRAPAIETGTVETAENRQRRFVYNGEPATGQSEYLTRGNRPLKRRKKSPFKIVSLLVIVSGLIVFYVWNKISVNRLAAEIGDLGSRLKKVESMNEVYRADINKKSNLDKITRLAAERLDMVFASEQPVWFEVENYVPRDPADEH
ncbi:MAG TPA: hypothetical protein VJO14_07440 [Bacteroidota bacterium]|nr:hypothetical protein [Bacteroidota bacterium]